MIQRKIAQYEVSISARMACAEDKSKYNATYTPEQEIEAGNYFQTLVERYQCYNYSNPSDCVKQGMGQFYIVTLTTIYSEETLPFERGECPSCNSSDNEEHLCPFDLSVHDKETVCNCCTYHTQFCQDSI